MIKTIFRKVEDFTRKKKQLQIRKGILNKRYSRLISFTLTSTLTGNFL